MKYTILLSLSFTLLTQPVFSQKLFAVFYENSANVVQNVTGTHFIIAKENGLRELSRDQATVFLKDIPNFLPGFLKIEDESKTAMDTDDQNRKVGNSFFFRYDARVTPSRDLVNPYIVFQWVREDKTVFIEAKPLDNLNEGEEQRLTLKTYVPDRYRLVEPTVHYMCMGFEIGNSNDIEAPVTPYTFALQKAGGGPLPDGNIKPIQIIPITPITDQQGNKREGSAHLMLQIDELGYVKGVEVNKCTEWIFAKTAMMDAPFFMFQPRIAGGKPVETKVVIPFKF